MVAEQAMRMSMPTKGSEASRLVWYVVVPIDIMAVWHAAKAMMTKVGMVGVPMEMETMMEMMKIEVRRGRHCSMLQHSTTHCNTLQHALQHTGMETKMK